MAIVHPPEMPSLLSMVIEAQDRTHDLCQGRSLRAVASALAECCRSAGVQELWGASQGGDRLLGAMLVLGGDELTLWRRGSTQPVGVIDGIVASTGGAEAVAEQLLRLGAVAAFGFAAGVVTVGATSGPIQLFEHASSEQLAS